MKFLRKFYKWSLIIIIPLLMGSYVRGCTDLFDLFYVLFCYNTFNAEYNDEAYYTQPGYPGQYVFVSDSGKIWHGQLENNCFPLLVSEESYTLNNLNKIEFFFFLSQFFHLIAVGDSGTILRSIASLIPNNWDLINSPTNNNLNGLCFTIQEQGGLRLVTFAVGDAGTVIRSSDGGLTWELLNFPFNVDLNDCSSPARGEVICVGSSSFAAYRTTDYGDTWEQINFGDVVPESIKPNQGTGLQRIYCFDNNISYIVGTGLVFRTNNNWNTYEFQDPGTTEQLNDVFFVAPDTGVIIGNNGTARFTSDGGQNWFEDPDVTAVLNGTTLKRIKKQADNFGLVVGEGGLSIAFARDSTAFTTVVDNENQVVTEYSLSQNYPNPFNPSTKISYALPERGFVTLKIYDVLGNEVAVLVNEEKSAGIYEATFDASGLSSDIYFYQLKANNEFVETKKLVLAEIKPNKH